MHRRYLSEESPPDTLARMNADLGKLAGRVVFSDEHIVNAKRFKFSADSLFCYSGHEVHPKVFPNSDIDHVVTLNHTAGALEGLKYGAISGAIAGAAIGFLYGVGFQHERVSADIGPPDSSGYYHYTYHKDKPISPALTALYGAAIGSVSFGGVGVFLGYTGGKMVEVKYRFPVKK
jgi:hypothetical protein